MTRSAGRSGHWVAVGAHQGSFAAAQLSRYCRATLEYPDATKAPREFVEAVFTYARDRQFDLVIPATDRTLGPLSKSLEQFAETCRVAMPAAAALEFASDKYRALELAQSLGIDIPRTHLIQSPDDLPRIQDFGKPWVIKDRSSIRWIGGEGVAGTTAYAYSHSEAETKAADRIRAAGDVLAQEFICGTGVGFSCFVIGGKAYLPFQWERVREVDPRGSASSARKSVPLNGELASRSEQLLIRMDFEGVAMVEYKRTSGNKFILMEINGRPWGSIGLPFACGIDYPWHMINWYLSGTLPPERIAYRERVLCRRVVGEMTHLANICAGRPANWPGSYPKFWASIFRIALPWRPGMCYDDVWLSDPSPGLAGIRNWFRSRR